ncbi:hypothetical protein [Nocardia sp. NPDC048505]|uniref:hypothetical protein n=1 Tax=unclassified Nocardia TaxID=2637762 RepID=UPI0033C8841E
MVLHGLIAEIRQDITTAEDLGDIRAVIRLQAVLSAAVDAADAGPRGLEAELTH